MKHEKLRIRFDGPALENHTIDVGILGRSLTGLGELLSNANAILNGDKVKVRVEMKADIEANCITMDFSIVMSLYKSVVNLIENEHVANAKEILEWLGILGSPIGVWQVYVWLNKNRKPGQKVTTKHDGGEIVISIEGNRKEIKIPVEVFKIAEDSACQKSILDLLSPLMENGITEATFQGNLTEVKITQEDAKNVVDACESVLALNVDPQIVVGHIVIHAPTFNLEAKTWKFKWNNRVESIHIGDSSIAETVLKRGRVNIGDAFKVKMEVIERRLPKGGFKQSFRVIEVLDFLPASPLTQNNFDFIAEDQSDEE